VFQGVFRAPPALHLFRFLGGIGHERINRAAVMALPKPLQTFFFTITSIFTQESTVPDLRRNVINDKRTTTLF
jgi:hypothetical protein